MIDLLTSLICFIADLYNSIDVVFFSVCLPIPKYFIDEILYRLKQLKPSGGYIVLTMIILFSVSIVTLFSIS